VFKKEEETHTHMRGRTDLSVFFKRFFCRWIPNSLHYVRQGRAKRHRQKKRKWILNKVILSNDGNAIPYLVQAYIHEKWLGILSV
jgi:hypothetical protein